MKMDLIQPFVGSLDTVLAEMMREPAKIADLVMEEDGYRKKGLAAEVTEFLTTRGGNLEDSRMVILGSEFGMMLPPKYCAVDARW